MIKKEYQDKIRLTVGQIKLSGCFYNLYQARYSEEQKGGKITVYCPLDIRIKK